MVESLKLSITDQQLPMFIRILELIIALYYGEIGGHKEGEGEEGSNHVREAGPSLPGEWGLFISFHYVCVLLIAVVWGDMLLDCPVLVIFQGESSYLVQMSTWNQIN